VRARDAAGNLSALAVHSFTVDTVTPKVTIAGPPDITNSADATLQFSADEAGVAFQCELDSEGFAPCSSPKGYTNLSNGLHTFRVRATDPAGNLGNAAHHWTVDTSLPQTTIDTGPPEATNSTTATFTFSSGRHRGS